MSRVNSTADLIASDQPVAEEAEKPQLATESTTSADQPTQSDEDLARSLAAAENNIVDDNEPLAKRRRTTRRAAGGDEPVFYGSYQSMSRDQLLSALVRLLRQAKPGSSSIMDLKHLVFATDYESSRGEVVVRDPSHGAFVTTGIRWLIHSCLHHAFAGMEEATKRIGSFSFSFGTGRSTSCGR